MAHLSPAVNLVWALLATMVRPAFLSPPCAHRLQLGSFLVFHLWSFDRFKCIR